MNEVTTKNMTNGIRRNMTKLTGQRHPPKHPPDTPLILLVVGPSVMLASSSASPSSPAALTATREPTLRFREIRISPAAPGRGAASGEVLFRDSAWGLL